jgi:hypothetical protein
MFCGFLSAVVSAEDLQMMDKNHEREDTDMAGFHVCTVDRSIFNVLVLSALLCAGGCGEDSSSPPGDGSVTSTVEKKPPPWLSEMILKIFRNGENRNSPHLPQKQFSA